MPRRSRRTSKKRVGEYLLAGFLALFLILLAWAVWGIARKEEIARRAVEDRKTELGVLEARKAVLEGNLAELSTERGQEAMIRQNRGVARAGEEVIIVVPPKEEEPGPPLPWHKKILGWFGIW